jgi:glycine betaine/proline transport system ATP-binding protein
MKDGAVEQCDTPDQIVLNPATPYVAKFTEEIEKSRVVHARVLAVPADGKMPEGEPIRAGHTILQLARQLVNDEREILPVATRTGELIGVMNRQEALDILLGEK